MNMVLRAFAAMAERARLAGVTFAGVRDMNATLGYKTKLESKDFRARYERGGLANRIVEVFPESTWRGSGELVEDEDPNTLTAFEQAWFDLSARLGVWSVFLRADILAGLGRYSVILIGAPGNLDSELSRASAEDIMFLTPFAEEDVEVQDWVVNPTDPRFGLPLTYKFKRLDPGSKPKDQIVHWSRVIHVADGLLDDHVHGTSRLKAVWNLLDDLDKVTGGGAEAFWLRANRGLQFDLDAETELSEAEEEALEEETENFIHNQKRIVRTRGMKINDIGSEVADFSGPAGSILDQICGTIKVPQRILLGSERGQLASSNDRENFNERVNDRRDQFAGPLVVRQFIDRLILLGALPMAIYDIRWPEIETLSETQKAEVGAKWAEVNQKNGETVVTADEIRDRVFGLPPLDTLIGEGDLTDDNDVPEDPAESEDEEQISRAAKGTSGVKSALRTAQERRWLQRKRRALLLGKLAEKRIRS